MKLFTVSGYAIDKSALLGSCLLLRHMRIEEIEISGKSLADFPPGVDLAELEKYIGISHNKDIKEG